TGALAAPRAAGGADVGAGRGRDERERAGREIRCCVESIELVKDPEIAERLTGGAEAQGVAQLFAWSGRCGGVCTTRGIRHGLVEEISRARHRHSEGILKVQDAGRAVW